MEDQISRQEAIADAQSWVAANGFEQNLQNKVIEWLKEFPPAQPEPFGAIKHAGLEHSLSDEEIIPRLRQIQEQVGGSYAIDRVIELLTEQHIDADGTLWITVTDIERVTRVIVDEDKSKFCRQFYMEDGQRTGEWIPQDHNKRAGNISTCVYYYPICSECGQVGNDTYKYCPHCGAKMISEGKTCDCYRDGTCIGTKEIDSCSCGGVKSKCDFYEHVRWEGDAE